jgi:hypothetical protein
MKFLELISHNIISPVIICFFLGVITALVKADLKLPYNSSRYLSFYLLMYIGFKGGAGISCTQDLTSQVMGVISTGVIVSFLQPFLAYGLLRLTSRLDIPTAAAVAAHYGSISIVTFGAALNFLKIKEIPYEGYILAILVFMEVPAIFSGLFIAHRATPYDKGLGHKILYRNILTQGPILILICSLLVGWIAGLTGASQLSQLIQAPFQAVLCFFLFDMGLLTGSKFDNLKSFTLTLILFGIYMPLIGGCIGLFASWVMELDTGTGMLFTVLCASASYIAVPASMKIALPEAKPEIYVPMSLAITFPFNITLGIPLYYRSAEIFLIN